MEDFDSPKDAVGRRLQDKERIAREIVFEQLIEYAVVKGLTVDQLKAMNNKKPPSPHPRPEKQEEDPTNPS